MFTHSEKKKINYLPCPSVKYLTGAVGKAELDSASALCTVCVFQTEIF